jgi:hypothetical protein
MSSKSEDFPTPVSPTRRSVYDAFAGFAGALMIPCLRYATLLRIASEVLHQGCHCDLLDSQGVILIMVFQGVLVRASRYTIRGYFATEWTT